MSGEQVGNKGVGSAAGADFQCFLIYDLNGVRSILAEELLWINHINNGAGNVLNCRGLPAPGSRAQLGNDVADIVRDRNERFLVLLLLACFGRRRRFAGLSRRKGGWQKRQHEETTERLHKQSHHGKPPDAR